MYVLERMEKGLERESGNWRWSWC